MKTKEINGKCVAFLLQILVLILFIFILFGYIVINAQSIGHDLAKYTPAWIKEGFADAGATHEPWIFQIRRNSDNFNTWQRDIYEYQMSEEYIKSLALSGILVYHIGCYKGFGFQAEKEYMDKAADAAALAHKYGMKVDTYVQWNTMAYETFFAEVPEAQADIWYQIDENGKPLLLTYGYQQSFRYRPCFNHDGYMKYYKEKIIRYVVENVKTDFIHFDNFDYNYPPAADFNPATIAAFRKYLSEKYSPEQRKERFGFEDISYILPPMWNSENPAEKMLVVNDPVIQEWIDFRCWTFTTRLAECARFARELNKEVVIEVNPHGLVGSNRAWEAGINHPDLMQYTNVIWTEDNNNPRWENGVAIGKFRHYKLGRTTNNYILTGNEKPQDFAENLALNRCMGFLGTGIPEGVAKKYLDFWLKNKDLYTHVHGSEKVAILRSYPSMAYNNFTSQIAVNMAEQALQQRQIPFDIIFDQHLDRIGNYFVIILANQESLTDETVSAIKKFVNEGGGLVITGNTGEFDGWRRLRKLSLPEEMLIESDPLLARDFQLSKSTRSYGYGKGKVVYIPGLIQPRVEVKLGFESVWMMPGNANELISAVLWSAGKSLPLRVTAPEWIGVSHDIQENREVIHLFNYNSDCHAVGVTLQYQGKVSKVRAVSPDEMPVSSPQVYEKNGVTELWIPEFDVYLVLVLEKK
jgi:hypothetical protein